MVKGSLAVTRWPHRPCCRLLAPSQAAQASEAELEAARKQVEKLEKEHATKQAAIAKVGLSVPLSPLALLTPRALGFPSTGDEGVALCHLQDREHEAGCGAGS